MKRAYLPIDALSAWARLNGVSMSGVAFRRLREEDGANKGVALVATEDKGEKDSDLDVLLQIPSDLILSLDCVETCAKSDPYLREILEAVGGFGKTSRGAILIFLLVQITYSSPDFADEPHRIGLSNPWTEYIKFMPSSIPLPTFYTDEEVELLRGTSLQTALAAKLSALEDELAHLQQSTENVPWCRKYWWDEEKGCVTLDDWKYVDAVFRSRMVDLPGHGTSMVPCIDMANHDSEDAVKAFYEKDGEGNAVLQMRPGKELSIGEEVTISYGDEKAASEMLFSYGFLEGNKEHIDRMFVSVEIPDDDPFKLPKKVFSKETPIITLRNSPEPTWTGGIVLWACVNEEDGLDFELMRTTDGEQELCMTWKGESIKDPQDFSTALHQDPMWDIFHLRAVVLVLERLESQYLSLRATKKAVSEIRQEEEEDELQSTFRPGAFRAASKLQKLESDMLLKHIGHLTQKRDELVQSEAVMSYLAQQADLEEDFS